MIIKSYRELCRLPTFEQRYEYLRLGGVVGRETFGFDRYLNQLLYRSGKWKSFRSKILIRDEGCDLAIPNLEIFSYATIHHINPITIEDVERDDDCIYDPENVITTSSNTHRAIHYGDASLLIQLPKERTRGDTNLWEAFSRI